MNKTNIRNPYQRGIIPLAGLTLAFGGIAVLVYIIQPIDLAAPGLGWAGLVCAVFFGLTTLIVWGFGERQVRRAKAFFASERPLVYWTYSQAEWKQIKEKTWQAERHDWQLQLGCLAVLLALAGLLTGLLIGADDGFIAALVHGLGGLLIGALAGGGLGVMVAGGNHLALIWATRDKHPGNVALGVGEIYANGDYFRADGRHSAIQSAQLIPGEPVILEVCLKMPPRVRMPAEEIWQIPISAPWVQKMEEVLPLLTSEI